MMLISSGMLFLYCIGAILAPDARRAHDAMVRPLGFVFAQNALIHFALAAFTLWRIVKRAPVGADAARSLPPCGGGLILRHAHVGRVGVLHADDMIAGVDMEDLARHAARHRRQQIDGAFADFLDRHRASQRARLNSFQRRM